MNDNIFAGRVAPGVDEGEDCVKVFAALSPCSIYCDGRVYNLGCGDAAVIPRRAAYTLAGECVGVAIKDCAFPVKVCIVCGRAAHDISWSCERAAREYAAAAPSTAVLQAVGGLIVAFIGAYCGGDSFSPAVTRVLAEIERGLSDSSFSLESAIKNLPLNYDYVRKLFKKEVGQTPLNYLISARMERARSLVLSASDGRCNYTVAQISELCGFAEPLYFSRVFKKYYGCSPTGYARRCRACK